ncbi:MAG: transposase [Nitrospirae bacterium]|nr:transposase [Nitrospirota bacterium]
MTYNREIHHRWSVRLKAHDYSQPGAYFVTVCAQNRECVFGEITDGKMEPNDAGRMVARWWAELNYKFPTVQTDESIVMPNHFHGIVVIIGYPDTVGAALRGRPPKTGHPHRGAPTLGDIVDWFKTMTTNDYIRGIKQDRWPPFEKRLWQRNYYERVVRDDSEMHRVREYITGNPAGWLEDEENPDHQS